MLRWCRCGRGAARSASRCRCTSCARCGRSRCATSMVRVRDDTDGGVASTVSVRVAVLVFPGTNSEDETLRAVRAVGLEGELVHWSVPEALGQFDAFILPGGFAHEDRVRSG